MNKNSKNNKSRGKKIRNIVLLISIVGLALFFAIRFYFPFGEGVKTGQLNYVVHKGVIFKTYEGKLIQSGFWTNKPGGIQSNEFIFSITNEKVARNLMDKGGNVVELHYTEYFGALPWRGYSKFVVDSIVSIKPVDQSLTIPPVQGVE